MLFKMLLRHKLTTSDKSHHLSLGRVCLCVFDVSSNREAIKSTFADPQSVIATLLGGKDDNLPLTNTDYHRSRGRSYYFSTYGDTKSLSSYSDRPTERSECKLAVLPVPGAV